MKLPNLLNLTKYLFLALAIFLLFYLGTLECLCVVSPSGSISTDTLLTFNSFVELEKFSDVSVINSLDSLNRLKTVSIGVQHDFSLESNMEAKAILQKLDRQIELLEQILKKNPNDTIGQTTTKSIISSTVSALVQLITNYYGK